MSYVVRVYDPDGAPVIGAAVTLGDAQALSGSDGVATFPDPAVNTWPQIAVSAAGFALDPARIFPIENPSGVRLYMKAATP